MPNSTNWLIEDVLFNELAGYEYDTEYSSGNAFFTASSGYKIQGEYIWWQQLYENSSTPSDLFGGTSEQDLLDLNFFRYTEVDAYGDYGQVFYLIMPKENTPEENPFADESVWNYETFTFDGYYHDDASLTDDSFDSIAAAIYQVHTEEPAEVDTYSIEYIVDQSIRCVEQCKSTEVPEASPILGLILLAGIAGSRLFKRR